MIASSVPVWATIVIAAITGLLGLSGTVGVALLSDRRRKQELEQERLLHGADSRLQALEDATATALLYRERVAAALRRVAGDFTDARVGVEPMWSWDREYVMKCRRHEAALSLLFGVEHPVKKAWQNCAWALAQAAEFAKAKRDWANGPPDRIPADIRGEADRRREATTTHLDDFFSASTASLDHLQPHDV
jgi:hypothetical protein